MENLKGFLSIVFMSIGILFLTGSLLSDPGPQSILYGLSKEMLILLRAKFVLGYLAGIASLAGFNGFRKWVSS